MNKIQLGIYGITYSQTTTGSYALILSELKGNRRIPIIIGGFEAQAIAIELENMKPSRPLTHDLFRSFAHEFDITIREVVIYKFSEGIFYSKIVFESDTKVVEIDSRTSDAVALAVRFKCPIYTYENIIRETGLIFEDLKEEAASKEKEDEVKNEFANLSDEELEEMLNLSINEENYELASRIRDEINRRKKK